MPQHVTILEARRRGQRTGRRARRAWALATLAATIAAILTAAAGAGVADAEGAPASVTRSAKTVVTAPRRRTAPVVSGAAEDGQLLTATAGVWKGETPMEFGYQWESCLKRDCTTILGATEPTYRADSSEIGQKLRVTVTAQNSHGTATAKSRFTSRVTPGPPVSIAAPRISGTPAPELTLEASTGSWAGTAPVRFTYQWLGCNLLGECSELPGATGPNYTVQPLDSGDSIEVVVTASNSQGSANATSPATSLVSALLPANTELPSVTGLLQDGQALKALTGAWSGTTPITFTYQWELCNSAGAACEDISEAGTAALSLISGYVGKTLRVVVTATNAAGSVSATSPATSLVTALLPTNTELPSVTGLLQDGQTLKALSGAWSGTTPLNYTYQWELCNGAGAACEDISEAETPALALISSDVGKTLRVVVTATNAAGSVSATSPATSLVTALLPTNTELPSVTGLLQDGQTLKALSGAWSGTTPLNYTYQWELCNGAGAACEDISEAETPALALISSDVGKTLRVVVTATNAAGSVSATSPATSLVAALLPSNTELPSITGLLQDGQTLKALTGAWSGTTPLNYTYQWELCNGTGAACENISEAGTSVLSLVSTDVGKTLRVRVTATNAAGSVSATSPATSLVAALLPSNTELPSITGLLQDGQTLKALTGAWSGTTPLNYTYQWQLCNSAGATCENISEAGTSALSLVSTDVGKTLRVRVTATNAAGSVSATSPATSLVAALLPANTELPSITGILEDGQLLTAHAGSWTGSTPLTYGFQWQTCGVLGTTCTNIGKAIQSTLKLELLDVGIKLRVVVTATNAGGSTSADSTVTGLIAGLL